MKSKITVYLLIAAVLVIWGVIAWKLFTPSRVETHSAPPSTPKTAVIEQTDTLWRDYPDPFLKKSDRTLARAVPTSGKNVSKTRPPDKIREECRIRYIGHIRRGKIRSCIVESGGSHHSLAKGESVDGFLLSKIFPDSLVFTKDGFSYTVGLSR